MRTRIKYIAITAVLMIAAAVGASGGVVLYYRRHLQNMGAGPSGQSPLFQNSPQTVAVPVPLGSPNTGLFFENYFFSGSIKELKKVDTGTQIILNTSNTAIPDIIAGTTTPISKIIVPPPPTPEQPQFLTADQLKVGMNVDVSMEFDPVLKHWLILEVYIPSNKNP